MSEKEREMVAADVALVQAARELLGKSTFEISDEQIGTRLASRFRDQNERWTDFLNRVRRVLTDAGLLQGNSPISSVGLRPQEADAAGMSLAEASRTDMTRQIALSLQSLVERTPEHLKAEVRAVAQAVLERRRKQVVADYCRGGGAALSRASDPPAERVETTPVNAAFGLLSGVPEDRLRLAVAESLQAASLFTVR